MQVLLLVNRHVLGVGQHIRLNSPQKKRRPITLQIQRQEQASRFDQRVSENVVKLTNLNSSPNKP